MLVLLLNSLAFAQPVPQQTCSLGMVDAKMSNGWVKIQGDMVNLRDQPSTSGKILAEIPLGSTANIVQCSKKDTIGNKTGCWYQIDQITTKGTTKLYSSAFLYFTAIADCFIAADFDEDGVLEEAYVSQTGEEQYQVRLSDPNAKIPMTWVVEDAFSSSTFITAVPKSETARTMLKLSTSPEACGYTGYTHYYIYDSKGKPTLHKAISGSYFSDSPAYFEAKIEWKNDGTLIFKEDHVRGSSSQKYCLKGFKYEPCGTKVEKVKEVEDTGM